MGNKIRRFTDLRVWQKGVELVKEIYGITKNFPKEELYGLSMQMRRAAVSIPSNIAEGFRRKYIKEYRQFLRVALGSCAELETQIIIARELNYLNMDESKNLMASIDYICRMLFNLENKL